MDLQSVQVLFDQRKLGVISDQVPDARLGKSWPAGPGGDERQRLDLVETAEYRTARQDMPFRLLLVRLDSRGCSEGRASASVMDLGNIYSRV